MVSGVKTIRGLIFSVFGYYLNIFQVFLPIILNITLNKGKNSDFKLTGYTM